MKQADDSRKPPRPLREIRELIRTNLNYSSEDRQAQIISAVSDLLDAIEHGHQTLVDSALARLGVERSSELYGRIGHLTRSLHDSIRELRDHLERQHYTVDSTNIPEATDKLEKIIEMTFQAAEQTFRYMDSQMESLRKIKVEIDTLESRLNTEPALSREVLDDFIRNQRMLLQDLAKTTLDIVIAQEYQDLTGQVLRKVIKLLNDIEKQLLSLVSIFGKGGADETREKGTGVELSQGDADKLLKKLGF